jgi:hypothetical protein
VQELKIKIMKRLDFIDVCQRLQKKIIIMQLKKKQLQKKANSKYKATYIPIIEKKEADINRLQNMLNLIIKNISRINYNVLRTYLKNKGITSAQFCAFKRLLSPKSDTFFYILEYLKKIENIQNEF